MSQQNKISLYNLADLKNTSDDAIPNYLNSIKFKQSHYYLNVRLALGYGAFLLAAACFAWDYYLGFEDTKTYTLVAVCFYAGLSAALATWIKDIEKGCVYLGRSGSGQKDISIATSVKKNVPVYNVTVTITDVVEPGAKEPEPQVVEISRPFTEWFDETGLFVAVPFQEMLASSVKLIGHYDPKRVKTDSQKALEAHPELLDAVIAAEADNKEEDASTVATAADAGKKGGRRRKA